MGEGQSEGNEMKFEKSSQAGSDQVQRSNGKSGEIRKDGVVHPRRNALDSPQATKPSSTVEPVQLGRQFRGNNGGFTDELTMKAHELKKLFAEIKTHALVDQSYPSGKERATRFLPHHGVTLGSDWSPRSVSSSGSLRGEFYERYMEKRESKMREQWKARRAEKEMKLRTLWDCFNRISIELRATSLGPADGYKSIQESRSKVEKLLSVNMRSSTLCIQQVSLYFCFDILMRKYVSELKTSHVETKS